MVTKRNGAAVRAGMNAWLVYCLHRRMMRYRPIRDSARSSAVRLIRQLLNRLDGVPSLPDPAKNAVPNFFSQRRWRRIAVCWNEADPLAWTRSKKIDGKCRADSEPVPPLSGSKNVPPLPHHVKFSRKCSNLTVDATAFARRVSELSMALSDLKRVGDRLDASRLQMLSNQGDFSYYSAGNVTRAQLAALRQNRQS